ncbi:Acetyltransferase (GNAT) family protein [compost metagenome]
MLFVDGRAAAYGVLHHQFFNCGFIEMLMVAPGDRQRGLARQLVDHLRSICARPKLFTSTNRSNTAMQTVLLRAGFQRSGHIDNLDEGDPEWVFFCPVSTA